MANEQPLANSANSIVVPPTTTPPPAPTTSTALAVPLTLGAIALQQALHVANIKNHINITLEQHSPNYNLWRRLFLVTLGKFNLRDHVNGSPPSTDPSWSFLDFTVLSWLYSCIHSDIYKLIQSPTEMSAYETWIAIENLFRDNKPARPIQLEQEFRTCEQGDRSIYEDCMRLKALADGLADVENPVTEGNLVLQVIQGLNESYTHLASYLQFQTPLPSFQEARNKLIIEELRRNQSAPSPATALTTTTTAPLVDNPPPAGHGSSSAPSPHQNSAGAPNQPDSSGRGRGRGRGRGFRSSHMSSGSGFNQQERDPSVQ